ncbi:hypothetical protein ACFQE1_03880 [Halobium palmae]|uniref:Uncharacterized protein n=1 Tax=Halobium palmae TaxID=1776492 RepID=A0ABD5RWD3_9EURY
MRPRTLLSPGDSEISTDVERLRHLPEGPLKMGKLALWWVRKTFFSKPKPNNPALFVRMTERELVRLFGQAYFEPGWEFSYSYRDEKLNLRRVEYVPDHPLGFEWWQVHIRGYLHEAGRRFDADTFELAVHFELEPTEYPSAHIDHVGLEIERGVSAVVDILDGEGIEYEYRHPNGEPLDAESISGAPDETG